MSGTSESAGKRSRQKLDLLIRRLGDKKKAAKGTQDVIPTLPRDNSPGRFQLSFAQQRLWLIDQLHPGSAVYNIAGAIDLIGDLDAVVLQGALEALCARHEALRTTLVVSSNGDGPGAAVAGEQGREPRQVVAPAQPFELPQEDLADLAEELRVERAASLEAAEARRSFDLAAGPLLRATLLRLQPTHHRLLVTLHHAVADGWSLGIVLREVATLYDAARHGRPQPLAALPVQYADVAAWQRHTLQGDKLKRELDYWRQRLDGVSTLELPTDRPRPAKAAFRGERLPVSLDATLASSLRRLAQAQSTTLFTVLETAFAILLARLTGQQDITVGMPVAGRRRKEMEGLVGLFVNTLVLRHQLEPGSSFLEVLVKSRDAVLGADAHQDVPFEKLVEELQPERHLSTTPFFQVAMAFEAGALPNLEMGGLTWQPREVTTGTSKFDLTFNLGETAEADGPIRGSVELDLDLFDVSTVERWWQHYQTILQAVVQNADTAWERLPLLDGSQRQQLVTDWNGRLTSADLSEGTISGLVTEQAQLHPDHVALVDAEGGVALTYAELEARANRLAHHLADLGAGPETLVGVCMERSVDLVVALLAVLKSGAAYLPLDLAYPTDRLAFMLEDSGARWLISESALAERLPDFGGEVLFLDADATVQTLADQPTTAPTPALSGDNLAYVIYTSGSTGKPKGVLIPHRHVARLMAACDDWFSFGSEDRWTFFHSHAFDFSVWEIWGALTTGGRLVVVPYWVSRSPDAFYDLLADQGVTVLNQTPSAFRQLVEVARHGAPRKLALREVIFGGEALDLTTLRPWFELFGDQQPRLVNMYGITETTVHVTFRALTAADAEQSGRSPVGEAIPDLSLHIVDAAGAVQPVGVAGEMWVGGAGLARGYLGRPGLTAERFVPHPFSTEPGARAYRSGDLARYLPDGDIDFLGRIDHQVKLRGFRIELGEIEARLQEQAAVAEAAVLVQQIQGDGQLVAYWVPLSDLDADSLPSVAELRQRLGEHLPDYMIPAFYVQLDSLPLTANGKLDRRALPLPDVEASAAEYVAPRSSTETALSEIWAETLGVERVGAHDDFFALGGHSLLATQIMARLRSTFGVEVPLRHLFEGPTVEDLATVVDGLAGRGAVEVPAVEPRDGDEPAVLSFAQERLWFLDQLDPGSAVYNIPVQVRLHGILDVDAFRDALSRVVERHEILRTVFSGEDGQARQEVLESLSVELPLDDLSHLGEGAAEEANRRAEAEARTPFDLAAGPLLRGHLLRLADDEHRLILNLHHIVADGWSVGVLLGELVELYGARLEGREAALSPLPVQYADVAVWQRRWLQGDALQDSLDVLRHRLADAPVLELPTDRPRPAVARQRGDTVPVRLDAEISGALERLAERQGITPYILLLAAFGTLLSRLTGQHDLTVGSPVANRRRVEMEGLIGCFVNSVVQRLDLSGRPSFEELVQRTRRVVLVSDEHQDVPFEQVVAAVEGERQLATSPLFQAMLVLQNAPFGKTSLSGLELEPLPLDSGTSKFDLTLALGESLVGSEQGLEGHLEYDADLFDAATVTRWWGHFEALLQGILDDPTRPVQQLPLLSEAQRRQLLVEWNSHDIEETWRQDGADTVADLFTAQVARTPDADALCFRGQAWTYQELARRVWFLAHRLQGLGVGPDRVVGVCLDRRPEMIIAMLAAQAAGGAYVPLDPNYPAQRLGYILEDTAAPVILTRDDLRHILPDHDGTVICLDEDAFEDLPDEVSPPRHGAGWENLAHLIYTSGSTGRPKGVAIAHRSSVILMHWARNAFSAEDLAGMMAATSINFDLSVFEILVPLCWGGTVILAENALELPEIPDRDRVRLVNTVPSAMAELVRQGGFPDGVRIVNLAGEPLRRALVDGIYGAAKVEGVYNLYGPSEDTTYSTYTRVPSGTSAEPTIGRPLVATQAYVLDSLLQPVPLGVVGELYLGGDGVARGYLGRPAMTAERFVPDHLGGKPGARLYRTGDLVRYLPDSEMLFLGRVDHQVKIRGFRIELGEIESALLEQPEVRDTVVMARREREGDPRLVAYVTSGEDLDTDRLRSTLSETLPDYMLPAAFVVLEVMPLLPNGKINRKALPAPDWKGDEETFVAPRNAVEEGLATLWQEVLDVERVGVHDNFFSLGGHSLLATQVITRMRRQFEVEVPLRQIFEAPTVEKLATVVDGLAGRGIVEIPPVEPRDDVGPVVLSFAQERFWFLDQLDPNSVVYNIPVQVRLRGSLDVDAFRDALGRVVERHEVLRTVFRSEDGQAQQVILESLSVELPLEDLSQLGEGASDEADRRAGLEARTPFDLAAGPLLRGSFLRLAEDEHRLILNLHHIIADGWSIGVLLGEVAELYGARLEGREAALPPLPVQYADVALWQHERLQEGTWGVSLDALRQQLADVPVLELPTDRPRTASARRRGGALPVRLDAERYSALERLAQQQGVTPYIVLLATFGTLLSRLTQQDDLTIGSPVANRRRTEMEGLIGCFVNTLVQRVDLSGQPSFEELVQRTRRVALASDEHQDVPFEQVVAAVEGERQLATSPLFQAVLALQNAPFGKTSLPGLELEPLPLDSGTSKFDLTLSLGESLVGPGHGLEGHLEYDADLFDTATVMRWWGHFEVLLQGILDDPTRSVQQLPLLGEAQRRQLEVDWNGRPTSADLSEATISGLVTEQAQRHPDHVALVDGEGGVALTYAELETRANRLAHHLADLGAGPETLVGVCMERSADLVVALLAVLKSGAAYLPLDLAYPTDRLAFMLEDSGARWLISESALAERLPDFGGEVLYLDADATAKAVEKLSTTAPTPALNGDNLAYVIYTSGSTGEPKGVLIPHRHVARLMAACDDWFSFDSEDRWTFFHSHAFDFSVWEIWGALTTGGRLVVVPYWVSRSPDAFYDLLADQGVTVLNQTPSAFRQLVEVARHGAPRKLALREVIFGGEALDLTTLRPWFELFGDQQPRLVNMYGITETTVHVTFRPLTAADAEQSGRSPVGEAIPDLSLHIVDAAGAVQPVGVAGEMWVGGAGLARGYLGRPGLTAERFVPHPFSSEPGARAYRSGDLARYLPDGDIDFLGRIDHQVKLRGFRIELGEIEARLQEQDAVAEAAVLVQQIQGDGQLVAYWVPLSDLDAASLPSVAELRQRLGEHLPDYMIPAFYVQLEGLPLTANGKLDRRALPLPDVEASAAEYVAPRSSTETALSEIWAEILGVERVGMHDDFFALGGHSLLATQITARLRQTMGVEVPLRRLFEGPTVAELGAWVERLPRHGDTSLPPLSPRDTEGPAPLSFAQERLWFLDQLDPDSAVYNIPVQLELRGALDIDAFTAALNGIIERHAMLRTVFRGPEEGEGEPTQLILDDLSIPLPLVDLTHLGEAAEDEADRRARQEARTPFDLSSGPLLRGHLMRLGEDVHRLFLNMHHIASDGWSVGVLLKELAELYGAHLEGRDSNLSPLPVQYADVAVWQRGLDGSLLDKSLQALRGRLADAPVLELPTDRPRGPVARHRGGLLTVRLDGSLSDDLERLAERQGVTSYMLFLAAFGTLLSRLTGQQDLTIGSPVANRRRVEMEGLIGCFVNTLVQRLDVSGSPTFLELLQRVHRVALDSDEHQDVPFERLVAALEGERQLATSPLFQAMLVLQNAPFGKTSLPGLELEPLPLDSGTSKFDLTLALGESPVGDQRGLEGHLEYDADLFDAATVTRWWGHFEALLRGVVAHPDLSVHELPLLSEAQRRQLLVEWNRHDIEETWRQDGADTVADLFTAQVARTPDADALCFRGQTWTYQELARRVWFLAHRLQRLGVGPDRVVGVCLDRRPEMIIAMLAAQAAGGAYVPLDPNYPAQRLGYILEDTAAPVILTRDALRHILPDHDGTVICLDEDAFEDLPDEVSPPRHGAGWENLAHLIYTSGSTGRPKGVAIAHRSSVILMHWARNAFSAEDLAGMMAATSINFDLSVFEILVPLCWGGTVILAENALELPEIPDRDRVRLVNTVPSAMAELVRQGGIPDGVRIVNLAGEPLRRALVDGIYGAAEVEGVYNLYGPSEDTTYSTYTRVPSGTSAEPTIGRPLVATQAYVLDSLLQPVPLGVVGELYLGGDGVARGYLGRPAMTAERFVPDHLGGKPGARLYRTGDLVRYLPDSEMLFLGRVDHQVKIRGFRIELGEIESALLEQPAVRDTVVMARQEREGDPRLVAYVTSGEDLDTDRLRSTLSETLPDYMLPAAFVVLDVMPLLPNGKINRKALPAPDWQGDEETFVAPRTAVEEGLANLWQEVLDVERVGVHDNFFSLGGHSLLATQVITRMRRQFEVEVPLRQIFEAPTVAELAEKVDPTAAKTTLPPLEASGDRHAAPLSFPQERLWFLDQLDPGRTTYNIPALVQLQGNLRVDVLERALTEVVARHDVLRTVFQSRDDDVLQVVLDEVEIPLPVDDLRSHGAPLEEGRRRARQIAEQPFDLAEGPLLRARLLRVADDNHWLVLVQHHIICDGWSVGVLLSEITALYEAFAAAEVSPLEALPVQYVDFARWQRQVLSGDLLETQLDFWRHNLEGVATLELPTDRPRPASPSQRGAVVPVQLDADLADSLRGLAKDHGVSLFMVLLASYGALLSRLSSQRDVAIGHPIANRRESRLEGMLGMFVNTLVARLDLSGRPDVATLLQHCRDVMLDADAHQDVPFEKIVADLQADRTGDRTPLFQAALVLQNTPFGAPDLPDVEMQVLDLGNGTSKFDLTLILGDLDAQSLGQGLGGFLEYDTDLFDVATIERWRDAWIHLLRGMLASPGRPVETLALLDPAMQPRTMELLDVRRVPYPAEANLAELYRRQAQRTPQSIVLTFEDEAGQVHDMTYAELDAHSDRLALHLLDLGVGPEQLVGLCAERSLEMIVATLAILKAGGAYLPLEPSYPQERLAWMMEDGEVRVLLAQQRLVQRLPGRGAVEHTVMLDGPEASWQQREVTSAPPNPPVHGRHLAYLMYTSGSTGRPKGVAVEQRSVSRLVVGSRFGDWSPERIYLAYAPISFDAATLEIWAPLLNGGRLILAPPQQLSIAELAAVIERHRVDTLWLTAGLFHQMVEDGPLHQLHTLRQWFAGGDVLSPTAVRKALEALPDCRMFNGYGPTENTTFTTTHPMDEPSQVGETVSIGRPISNSGVQILDGAFQPMPVGVFGQLCASGDGLARGYHKRPALTAEKWVPDPLSKEPGARIYLTGDRARYLDNGELEFQGRIDRQVKVRGFRIEPGEVEQQVVAQPEVRQGAIVVLDDPPRGKRLVAFVVPHEAHRGDAIEELLRQRLADALPPYMVPSAFQVLDDELPLDSNGKVDRKALARRPVAEAAAPSPEVMVAPRNAVEARVAELWCEVLGLPEVSVEADFFELGGHSLLATQVVSRLRKVFDVDVPLRHLFQSPTVAALAEVVQTLQGEGQVAEAVITDEDLGDRDLRLSFAQERLWLLDRFEPGNPAYNMPFALRLKGFVEVAVLQTSMERLVARHESLRTVYAGVDGYPVQHILPQVAVDLPLHDLSSLEGAAQDEALQSLAAEQAQTSFDLAAGPVFRVHLVRLSEALHAMLFNIHHIASDGWSMGLLTRDLGAFYAAEIKGEEPRLPALPVRYVDYAQWQRRWLQGEALERQVGYWKQQLADLPASLDLPTDRPRPAVRSFTGDQRTLRLDGDVLDGLKALSHRHGNTLFMTLLAVFKILLSRLSGQVDLAVGTPIAGRQRQEVEDLVGIFLNTLVLRGDLSGNPSFEALLERVRETTLGAYGHQDLPFEKLLDELQPERDMARTPFFQVFFNMVNMPLEPLRLSGLAIEPEGQPEAPSKFDLTVYAREGDNDLSFEWVFNRRLFDVERVEEMLAQYELLLQQVAQGPQTAIDGLSLRTLRAQKVLPDPIAPLDDSWRGAVHEHLAQRAQEHPERLAVRDAHGSWTYGQLDAQSNRLAHWLRSVGVDSEDPVAILAHRSASLVWAVQGVLKSGGAFTILDPAYPAAHLVKTVERARPKAWLQLADAGLTRPGELPEELEITLAIQRTPRLVLPPWHSIDSEVPGESAQPLELASQPETAPSVSVGPDDLAYISFTSGSTGVPKGILGRHGPLTHFLPFQQEQFGLDDDDVYSMLSGLAHDPLQRDMFTPICLGASLTIPQPELMFNAGYLARWMRQEKVTIAHMTPAMGQVLTEPPSTGRSQLLTELRFAFITGDVLTQRDVVRLRRLAPSVRCTNSYGSTETQRAVAFNEAPKDLGKDGKLIMPLGKGMRDVQLLVVNRAGDLAGIGELGEVWLRSPHLSRGYLGDAELTADRFLVNPFQDEASRSSSDRVYRTGDLGRYQADGTVVFAGRADQQVKIRGFRIELGEIEGQLAKLPGVREAVVQVRGSERSGERRLLAMLVRDPSSDEETTSTALREALRRRLPEYMVPAGFVFLERLPLTPNGKLDRRALAQIDDSDREIQMAFKAPRTEMEVALADILKEVLQIEQVGADDNFFDLGGNSLLLVQFNNHIQQLIGREIQAVEIFNHPTVASLAAFLTQTEGGGQPQAEAVVEDRADQLKSGRNRLKARRAKRKRP